MAQGRMSTKAGGRNFGMTPGDEGEGKIQPYDVVDFATTTCSGNLVIADGTVGGDERKVAEGARYKTGSG